MAIYVREAHPTDGWRMPSNDRVGIIFGQPTKLQERVEVAEKCCQSLAMSMPLLVDDLNDHVGHAYSGMPDRLYIIDRSGRVAYKGGRGPRLRKLQTGRDGAIAGDDPHSIRRAICNGRIREENTVPLGRRNALVAGEPWDFSVVSRNKLRRLCRDGQWRKLTPSTTSLRIMFKRGSVQLVERFRQFPVATARRARAVRFPPSAPAPPHRRNG